MTTPNDTVILEKALEKLVISSHLTQEFTY